MGTVARASHIEQIAEAPVFAANTTRHSLPFDLRHATRDNGRVCMRCEGGGNGMTGSALQRSGDGESPLLRNRTEQRDVYDRETTCGERTGFVQNHGVDAREALERIGTRDQQPQPRESLRRRRDCKDQNAGNEPRLRSGQMSCAAM
jgi:hypothetical protein